MHLAASNDSVLPFSDVFQCFKENPFAEKKQTDIEKLKIINCVNLENGFRFPII